MVQLPLRLFLMMYHKPKGCYHSREKMLLPEVEECLISRRHADYIGYKERGEGENSVAADEEIMCIDFP
jgi:hypothetical protein